MSLSWMPLESNPAVMNTFLHELGVPEDWGLSDVYSVDLDAADMVPQPCVAMILLLPITDNYIKFIEEQEQDIRKLLPHVPDAPYFMRQTIPNACGTVALIHALANNMERIGLTHDSILRKFVEATKGKTPDARGRTLEDNIDIARLHEAGAVEGDTEAPAAEDDIDQHFIAFVNFDGMVVELDGRKNFPLVHSDTVDESFVKNAFCAIQKYMSVDPFDIRYSVMSLGPLHN